MIPENSFLRKIPWAFKTKDRMELEAIAFAIDAIYLRHRRILNWAAKCEPESFSKTPHNERLELFLDLWSIVDQVYVLRKLLKKLSYLTSVAEFFNITKDADCMRNGMDHLPVNISNISSKKKSMPVYGALSFGRFYWDSSGVNIEDFEIYTITAGSLTHKSHEWPVPNPATSGRILEIPVGMFEFSSFDRTLDISSLVRSLKAIINISDKNIERTIRDFAAKEGSDAETLIADHAGSITTVMQGRIG